MLKIRREQLVAFTRGPDEEFAHRLVLHLHDIFSERCDAMGMEEVRASVKRGMEAAAHHGFETELDVARYVDLMYMLSFDFDRSGEYPWAEEILADGQMGEDPRRVMTKLWERAKLALFAGRD